VYAACRVWLGDGAGGWTATAGFPATGPLAAADFDRDGRNELVAVDVGSIVVRSHTPAGWQLRAQWPSWNVTGVVVVDVDRDGELDLVASTRGGTHGTVAGRVGLARGRGGATFGAFETVWEPIEQVDFSSLAGGDLDGDSWPDLVACGSAHPILLWNESAGLSQFGVACASASGAPRTIGIGQPTVGNTAFAVGLEGAAPLGATLLWLGLDNHAAPGSVRLPFDLGPLGAPGCAVLVSAEAPSFATADAAGRARVALPIPNSPALRRVVLFAQGAAAAPGANQLGWLFGNGLGIKIH
jgi:hypothetical protein